MPIGSQDHNLWIMSNDKIAMLCGFCCGYNTFFSTKTYNNSKESCGNVKQLKKLKF